MNGNQIDPRLEAIRQETTGALVKYLVDTYNLAQEYQTQGLFQEANQLYNSCHQVFNLSWIDKDYLLNIIVNVYLAQSALHWSIGSREPAFRLALAGLKYFEGGEQIPPQGYDPAALPPADEGQDDVFAPDESDEEREQRLAQEYIEFAQLMGIQASFHCLLANYWATFPNEFSRRKAQWAFEIALSILEEHVPESPQIAAIEEAIDLLASGKLGLLDEESAGDSSTAPSGEPAAPPAANADHIEDRPA